MNRREKRANKKDINLLGEVVKIMKQYFPELMEKFDQLTDNRHQSYVVYKMRVIFMVRLLGLICSVKSMNELSREFNTEEAKENIAKICGVELEEIPHYDTINDVFEKIDVKEIEKINYYLIKKLIRSKMLYPYRIRGRYFHIVIDATCLATSRKKYNEKCLIKKKVDKRGKEYKEYSTYVLEAKLVVGDMVFSIGSEFVENKEDIEKMSNEKSEKAKQDCEINAFKRLVEKIKKNFSKLNIVISGDALYAKSTVIEICKEYGWKYIIRFKEGAIPTLYNEFEEISKKYNESKIERYELVNSIEYKGNKTNVIRYKEIKSEADVETEFTYITDLPVSNKNIEETVNLGSKRWKIENEGFNIQKNGTFNIGHLFSKNENAIKVHYLLIQMAHLLRQLLEKGSTKIKELKLKLKEISQQIKQMLISNPLNLAEDIKIQLRFYG